LISAAAVSLVCAFAEPIIHNNSVGHNRGLYDVIVEEFYKCN
jgi:hypothetical protein